MDRLSLDFDLLDDLALGIERRRLDGKALGQIDVDSFGPVAEAAFLSPTWAEQGLGDLNWLNAESFQGTLKDLQTQSTQEQRNGAATGWICGDQLGDEYA